MPISMFFRLNSTKNTLYQQSVSILTLILCSTENFSRRHVCGKLSAIPSPDRLLTAEAFVHDKRKNLANLLRAIATQKHGKKNYIQMMKIFQMSEEKQVWGFLL